MVDTTVFSMFSRREKQADDTLEALASGPAAPDRARIASHAAVTTPQPPHKEATPLPPLNAATWSGLQVDHEFIGLANPEAWIVSATVGESDAVVVNADLTGLYRPTTFRAAPWSGFSYDIASDRRGGLVAGTRLLTARGEIAVEHLIPGDCVMSLRGPALLPVQWIGRSEAELPPVLIEAGALGAGRPNRALCVGQDQPVFADPTPVPARRLVNGTTIRILEVSGAELFHIDVGRQEVLFAQNLALASAVRPL